MNVWLIPPGGLGVKVPADFGVAALEEYLKLRLRYELKRSIPAPGPEITKG
jgi:hypothetical protein